MQSVSKRVFKGQVPWSHLWKVELLFKTECQLQEERGRKVSSSVRLQPVLLRLRHLTIRLKQVSLRIKSMLLGIDLDHVRLNPVLDRLKARGEGSKPETPNNKTEPFRQWTRIPPVPTSLHSHLPLCRYSYLLVYYLISFFLLVWFNSYPSS
jgi:hypothetical protein